MAERELREQFKMLSIVDVRRFLEISDWQQASEDERAAVYEGPLTDNGQKLSVRVPTSDANVDYWNRIEDIIRLLSAVRNESLNETVRAVSLVSHDVSRIRVLNPGEYSSSLPLDIAAREVNALKTMFVYSAMSEKNPRPFHERPSAVGENHARLCQFGHTFEGSFGFTVNSPLASDYGQLSLLDGEKEAPFERRVMERIATGLKLVAESQQQQSIDPMVDNFELGFDSKACDALVDLSLEKTKTIEFAIEWSPRINPGENVRDFASIRLDDAKFEIIEAAGKALKEVEPFDEVIIGPIVTLHSNKDPFGDEESNRTATIKHTWDGRLIDVKLELNKAGYEIAYKAHGAGHDVRVSGKLYRSGTTWRMYDISSIQEFVR